MTHLKYLKPTCIATAAMLNMACAQALTPIRAPHLEFAAVPSPRTQTLGSIGDSVGVMVMDTATRRPLPIYQHRGEYWVAGAPGQGYELWLTSRLNNRRALATTSVDGINVITGETAAPIGRGYVLSPHSTATVAGWRKSEHEVAAFNFAAAQTSYAAQTGRPANVGVIGVAVFPELRLPPPPVYRPAPTPVNPAAEAAVFSNGKQADTTSSHKQDKMKMESAPTPAAAPSMADARGNAGFDGAAPAMKRSAAPSVAQGLGTQHGERMASYALTVAFKRESNAPAELITLRYDTVDNLVARGVLQWRGSEIPATMPAPRPFPSSYVPDPPRQW